MRWGVRALLPLAAVTAGALAPWRCAGAGEVQERVLREGTLRCGASPRAGFAEARDDGRTTGLAVDLCRALTIAVLGPAGRTLFRTYGSARDYDDAVRAAGDDVAFLAADEVVGQGLAGAVVPGPTVFVAELAVLAREGVAGLAGLAGRTVCFMSGSAAHQALEAWAARRGVAIVRGGYQEEGEMRDAFDAGRCDAVAGEATELAAFRSEAPGRAAAQVLPPLAVVPVTAATPVADGRWSGLVGWSLAAVVQSEATPGPWRSDPPGAVLPGLRPGWQRDVAAALGGYGDMVARAFAGSAPGLGAGPNASWPEGLLLPAGPR